MALEEEKDLAESTEEKKGLKSIDLSQPVPKKTAVIVVAVVVVTALLLTTLILWLVLGRKATDALMETPAVSTGKMLMLWRLRHRETWKKTPPQQRHQKLRLTKQRHLNQ